LAYAGRLASPGNNSLGSLLSSKTNDKALASRFVRMPSARVALHGAAIAVLVFSAAVVEALVFPGTYRATALIVVGGSGSGSSFAAEPFRVARLIEDATLEGSVLQELGRARREEADGIPGAAAAMAVRDAVRFTSADAKTIEVSYTDPSPKEAQRLCELVARAALDRAPPALARAAGASEPGAASAIRLSLGSSAVRWGWPDRYQRLLLVLGSLTALVAGAGAAFLRARTELEEMPELAEVTPEPLPESAPAVAPALAPKPLSPATTLPLAPPATSPHPLPTPIPSPLGVPLSVRPLGPAPSTERMHAMQPAPAAVQAPLSEAGVVPRSYTPAGIGTPAVPMPLRRSTMILGSPVLPTPIPPKPTPTSLARPSPLPPTSLAPGRPPSQPPPPRISSRPPPPSLASPSSRPFERQRGRYSYVSTPVPRADPPVKVHEREAAFNPDSTLQVEPHKPWRRQLFTLGVAHCFVTAVTSIGEARRAKARLATELALCLAETGHARVLLVEADFPEPEIRRLLRVEILEAESIVRQTSEPQQTGPWSVLRLKPSLHALVQATPAQPELVVAERFRECVITLCAAYDFIVLNGPPIETGLPLQSLSGWVDGMVVATESATLPGVAEARIRFQGKAFFEMYAANAVR
jgi:Mrp family chromosome partitioning ATPase